MLPSPRAMPARSLALAVVARAGGRASPPRGSTPTPAPTRWSTATRRPSRPPSRCGSSSATTRSSSLAEGDLRRLVLTANLGQLLRLEGCLAGQPARGGRSRCPGPARSSPSCSPAKFVSGPATFLNQAVIGIGEQLGGSCRAAQARQRGLAGRPRAQARRRRASRGRSSSRPAQAAAAAGRAAASRPSCCGLAAAVRDHQPPAARRPDASSASVVFDPRQRRRHPEGASSPTCSRTATRRRSSIRLRPDLTDVRAPAGARADPRGGLRHDPAQGLRASKGKPALLRARRRPTTSSRGAPVVVDGLAGDPQGRAAPAVRPSPSC